MTPAPVPRGGFERRALCVTCRTPLAAGEACDVGADHEILTLTTPEARARAVSAAWISIPLYADQESGCGRGCAGYVGLGVVLGVYGKIVGRTESPFELLCLTTLFVLLCVWFTTLRKLRPLRTERRPRGASVRLDLETEGSAGVVAALGDPRAACARLVTLKLYPRHGGGVTLRDAWSEGFEVDLADGQRALVPAGRIRLEVPPSGQRAIAEAAIEEHLRLVDPLRTPAARAEPDDPFPYEEGYAFELSHGDRVQMIGELELAEAGHQEMHGTSALPPPRRPRGVPRVRLVRRAPQPVA